MTPPPWHMTHSACERYAWIRKRAWTIEVASDELRVIAARAHYVERDRYGRELWRSPRHDGALRWVVDPRSASAQELPQVIWIGQSKPPSRIWAP